jgi:hypothetical protein
MPSALVEQVKELKSFTLALRSAVLQQYVERVAYRLKKWCGVAQERTQFSGKSKGPHQEKFCEGCKARHCSEGRGMDRIVQKFSSFSL